MCRHFLATKNLSSPWNSHKSYHHGILTNKNLSLDESILEKRLSHRKQIFKTFKDTVVKCDFFTVGDQAGIDVTVFPLKLLLSHCQLPDRSSQSDYEK